MTTIVYKEEMITSKSPISGNPRNVQKKTFTVQIEAQPQGSGVASSSGSRTSGQRNRGGSPRPQQKMFSVRGAKKPSSASLYSSHSPQMFTITAYLPHDGGKRLKLQCTPGQSVQQVIESEIPDLSQTGYQVYQFPSRALLNPEKDASVLQDQEISIEPMRAASPDEVDDDRLAIVKDLLRSEDTYLENLRNIFDIYMDPLKKWGLPQADMNIMFRALSRLCDVLMNFFSELELSVMHWNPNTTPIGGLFKQYRSFWEMYNEYNKSYAKACKLLKDKRMMDESFNRFLDMKRGAAMHTLESLMLLPVQRIYEYHKILMRLYSLTPKEHPDYHDLRFTITCVGSMVQAREHQLNQNENELRLEQVQSRFPQDNLHLFQPLDIMEARSTKRSRTYTSTALSTPSRHMKSPHHTWMSSPALGTPSPKGQDMVDGANLKNKTRLYLSEGPVRIYSGVQSHDRFLFLFDDILIISKPIKQKSQLKHFKRKGQLRLSELWVTECQDKSLESILVPNTYFVIGWPFTNCVAAFSTPDEKNLWFNNLKKYNAIQRQLAGPEKISVQVLNFTITPTNVTPTWLAVSAQEEARVLLSRAVETMNVAVSEGNCQLWAKITKDEAVLLAGHEFPYAIQMYHNRHRHDYSDKPSQLQFIVKRKDPPVLSTKYQKKSVISLPWKKPRSKTKSKSRRVFGAPLGDLIVNNELPDLLQEILVRLYTEAPASRGIFRHSANYKRVRTFMDLIDNRAHLKLYDCSIHEVGALLKNLLRNVPGGILLSSRYTEFVATNDFKDVQTRVQQIQKVLTKLPDENQLFLSYLMPLLHHISKNHEINGMNSVNLAICFAPSLLWPSSGLDVIKNEVPPLIQFMIEHCPDIFGAELPVLYKQAELTPSPGVDDMEFSINAPTTQQFVPTKVDDGEFSQHSSHKRSDSIGSSMSEGSTTAEPEETVISTLLRARRSGLTLSDSQISQISQLDERERAARAPVRKRGKIEASGKHIHDENGGSGGSKEGSTVQSPVDRPSPKRPKKTKMPERSSSLHGPNDMSYVRTKYIRNTRPFNEAPVRRKSIAVQDPIQPRKSDYVPGFDVIPPSPNSSYTSSSHSYSPKMYKRIHGHQYYSGNYGRVDESSSSSGQKKTRRPQYSHSFTSKEVEKPRIIPSSSSFYDKLPLLDSDDPKRSKHRITGTFTTQMKLLDSDDEALHQRPILTTAQGSFATNSSHSVSSTGSTAQTRPSNLSLASSGSGASPDLVSKIDRGEFIKVAISERFKLNSSGGIEYPQSSASFDTTPSTSRDSFTSPIGSESGQDSLERIQRKFQERKRLDSNGSESAFSKSSSYKGFLNSQQKKDSLISLAEESHVDDRPECDLHLGSIGSLTRQRTLNGAGVIPEPDSNRLYAGNGYNSDTESAPSRTLSRPGKIKEVSSPTKVTMPSRYNYTRQGPPMTSQQYHQQQKPEVGKVTLSSSSTSASQLPSQQGPRALTQQKQLSATELQASGATGGRLYGSGAEPPTAGAQPPSVPVISEPLITTTRIITKTTSSKRRPRSGDRVERLTEVYKAHEKAREQEQVKANIEDAKVKLGLIPAPSATGRQRSKSTSENEAMKIIHRTGNGAEGSAQPQQDPESSEASNWNSKHQEWLLSAPTSAERKKAREDYSKSQFQRMEFKSRSLRASESGSDKTATAPPPTTATVTATPTVVTTKLTVTPETKRKCSTLPDNLSPGFGRHIKTVKVRTYEIPEAQKIRRINLRTYH